VPFGPSTVTLVTEIGYPGSDQDDAKLMAGQSGAVSVACNSSSTVLWRWRQVARTALGWPNQARNTNSRCDDRFATTPPPDRARSYCQPRCGLKTCERCIDDSTRVAPPSTPARSRAPAATKLGQNARV